jgi:DNA (cytosine-5)-methyltransferase 1
MLALTPRGSFDSRPVLLDVCCGAGGAAEGYKRRGFRVIGIDKDPQPRYAGDEFIQADAIEFLDRMLASDAYRLFAGAHASPPCQAHSDLQKQSKREYPDLIAPVRERLQTWGIPYVIENVEGAPLVDPAMLCGTMFPGLRVIRHRLFEANFHLQAPVHGKHPLVFTHDKRKAHYGQLDQDTSFVQVTGGGNATVANKAAAMGIGWMTGAELNEAIPPAYAEHVGQYLMAEIVRRVEVWEMAA